MFDYLVPGYEKKIKLAASRTTSVATGENEQTVANLAQEVADCVRCGLRDHATHVVFGDGNPQTDLLLVGDGTGAEEDKLGLPFVGPAGQLLTNILAAVEISREEVYLTDVVKCYPSENRPPTTAEITTCVSHLQEQIIRINPRIIVCLGTVAAQALIDPTAQVAKLRGQWFERGGRRIMATYHPATLLAEQAKKRPVWHDMQKVRDAYRALT